MMAARRRVSPLGAGRSRATVDSEKMSRRTRSTAWSTVLVKESMTPDVTAMVADSPCRWKKRMFTASRARLEGRARFM